MSLYLDASVLVPLVVIEPQHPNLWDFLNRQVKPFAVTSFARGEAVSALSRLIRTRRLTREQARMGLADLDLWFKGACVSPSVEDGDIRIAAGFIQRFDLVLKLPDAIHLACARRLELPLLTLDKPLHRAADALGIAANVPA